MVANVIISDENIFQSLKDLIENPEKFVAATIEIGQIAPLEIKLIGDQFHHSLTTTVLKGLVELQEAINRSYCIARYDSPNLNYLKDYERDQLELIFTVNPGCTEIITSLKELLEELNKLFSNMTPKNKLTALGMILIAILGYNAVDSTKEYFLEQDNNQTEIILQKDENQTKVALEQERSKQLSDTQESMVKAFETGIDSQNEVSGKEAAQQSDTVSNNTHASPDESDIDEKDGEVKAMLSPEKTDNYFKVLSPISTEKLEVIEKVRAAYPVADSAFNVVSHGVERLIKSTAQADIVRYNNVVEMSGSMAKKIDTKPRQESEKTVMIDEFRVLEFDSSRTDVRKTKLRSPDGIEFLAKFTDGSIGKEKIGKLNEAFWGYHPIDLSIEAKKSKGKIKDALITQVRDVNTKHSFKEDDEHDA